MSLEYRGEQLFFDGIDLKSIAEHFGTPCYVYSENLIRDNWARFENAFVRDNHLICYAVKANANPSILMLLRELGSGFDIVSAGEMKMVLNIGAKPESIVFSGVGKSRSEIAYALENRIGCFNVESVPEIDRINEIAGRLGHVASIAIRANPDIDPGTHPYIATGLEQSKFGIPVDEVPQVAQRIRSLNHVNLKGLACHIGSQIENCGPFIEAATSLESLRQDLASSGFNISHMDLGGGLAATTAAPTIRDWIGGLEATVSNDVTLKIEPGRSMVGNAGILLTQVEYLKRTSAKNFAIVDAGMNDFIRPALYQGWHEIMPYCLHQEIPAESWDIVGPVCESADFLAQDRKMSLAQDDLLALTCAGAYGYVMSSTYNGRPRPAEVIINQDGAHLVRKRQADISTV